MTILHITSRPEWQSAEKRGLFAASSLMSEGFIHFSTPEQVVPVANALYHGQNGLVLLVVDEARLKPELRWEPPASAPAEGISDSDLFPHVYGPLNVDAVVNVLDFSPDQSGTFTLPALN
ncbi:MAG: DUF952 domain-containing protein [Bacteroidota bacterium]